MAFTFLATSTGIFSIASSVMTEANGSTYATLSESAQQRQASSFERIFCSMTACTSAGLSPWSVTRWPSSSAESKRGSWLTRSAKRLFLSLTTAAPRFEKFSDLALVELLHRKCAHGPLGLQLLQELRQ